VYREKIGSLPFSENGMTLLEIMLAIVMLAAVMAMVSISISGSINVINATEKQGEVFHRAQVALQRISEDLATALLVEGIGFSGYRSENGGERENILEFTSSAHIIFDPEKDYPGIALISYRMEPDRENEGEFVLLRSDEFLKTSDAEAEFDDDGRQQFLLCDRLLSVSFSYFDDTGEEYDTWFSEPQDTDSIQKGNLPVSVDVTLEFRVDRDAETSVEFTTRVLLPVGLINAEINPEGK
jgi:type II secretory pathway pseudopilin PulG